MARNHILENVKLFDSEECPICYSPQVGKAYPPCGHVCCSECLGKWRKYRTICPVCTKEFTEIISNGGKDVKTFKPTITRSAHNQRLFNAMPIFWSISIPLLIVLIFCFPFSNITKLHSMSVLVPIICSSVFVYFNVRQNNEIRQWRENFSSMIYYCSWFILLHIISILVIFIIVYVYELVFGIDLLD